MAELVSKGPHQYYVRASLLFGLSRGRFGSGNHAFPVLDGVWPMMKLLGKAGDSVGWLSGLLDGKGGWVRLSPLPEGTERPGRKPLASNLGVGVT
jgi:hypothetical protein